MEFAVYVFTIVVMLVCAAAATSCLSAFAVTRNRVVAFLAVAFLLYFFDLSSIFQNEYLNLHDTNLGGDAFYEIRSPYLKIVVSAGVLGCLWLALLEYLNKRSNVLSVVPLAVFLAVAVLITEVMAPGPAKQWCFYSIREAFVVWIIAYVFYQRGRAVSSLQKSRLNRLVPLMVAATLLVLCIVAENTIVIMVWQPAPEESRSTLLLLLSERNLSENIFIMLVALFAIHSCFKMLRIRRKTNVGNTNQQDDAYIKDALDSMSDKYKLTKRERDVLSLVVEGKDYQNIASSLQLALGTVKSHMHNIFQKTGVGSTAELLELFWGN